MHITINGEELYVKHVWQGGYLPLVDCGGAGEYYVAEDSEQAGKRAREYWEDMARNDPKEFACIVSEEVLVSWALGRNAGPGRSKVSSLEEWLDLHLDCPEEQWGGYDGSEIEVEGVSDKLEEELGFIPAVAYRWN